MSLGKVICVYPIDLSTDFLMPVYEELKKVCDFIGYRFDTNVSQRTKELFSLQNFDKNSKVVFLGHGASDKLYGSVIAGEKQVLFTKNNIDHIKDLDFICIACRSNEFAKGCFQNYIGFGDITSDFSEVIAERDLCDPSFLDWAEENDINNFRNLFVESLKNAIVLSRCVDIVTFYKMIKLSINNQITKLLLEKKMPNFRALADMLFTIQNEMDYQYKPSQE